MARDGLGRRLPLRSRRESAPPGGSRLGTERISRFWVRFLGRISIIRMGNRPLAVVCAQTNRPLKRATLRISLELLPVPDYG